MLYRDEFIKAKTPSPPILPRLNELQQAGNLTPNTSDVKGILRPSGTPGSGNGGRLTISVIIFDKLTEDL